MPEDMKFYFYFADLEISTSAQRKLVGCIPGEWRRWTFPVISLYSQWKMVDLYLGLDYSLVVPELHIQATEQIFGFTRLEFHLQMSEVLISFQNCSRVQEDAGSYIRNSQIFFLLFTGAKYSKLEINYCLNWADWMPSYYSIKQDILKEGTQVFGSHKRLKVLVWKGSSQLWIKLPDVNVSHDNSKSMPMKIIKSVWKSTMQVWFYAQIWGKV